MMLRERMMRPICPIGPMSPIRLPGLILLFLLSCTPLFAQGTPAPKHWFSDMAQDGKGTVWGLGSGLMFFDGKEWKAAPATQFEVEDRAQPMRLARLQDGSIACLWRLSRERIAVTRHTPVETRLMGMCQGRFENSNLRQPPFADSHGRLWLTNTEGDIYQMDKDGKLALAWSIKPGQLDGAGKEKPGRVAFIFAAEDGRGRVWMWSNSLEGGARVGDDEAVLRGVLVEDRGKFTQQEHFEGITNNEISFVDRKDEKHMWVGTLREGIFSVDIDTMKAEPLHEPEPNAFVLAQKVFSSGDDLFVLTSGHFAAALWRLHGGKWTRLMNNIDGPGIATPGRPWLRAGDDTIIACYGADPLIVHGDGTPDRLDWRHGLTIGDARFFFQLPDGRMLAYGGDRGLFVGNVSLPQPAKPSRATELAFVYDAWTIDPDGNIWTMLSEKSGAISKWDGNAWHEYPIPEKKRGWGFHGLSIDSRGRVWLAPAGGDYWTAFLDPRDGKWVEFENLQAALGELKNDPPQFPGVHRGLYLPDYSADLKQAAFRSNDTEIVYFDGGEWRRFKNTDIDKIFPSPGNVGDPFFDAGRLCVSIGGSRWEFGGQGWEQSEAEAKYPYSWPGQPRPQQIQPPAGCVTNSPDSIAADNQGAFWLTWRGKLYKCGYGKCVEVFTKDETDPFAGGRKVFDAWVDARGNAFLQADSNKRVMIAPASPQPAAPALVLEKTGPDSVAARVQGGANAQLRCRLDDGPWQDAKGAPVTFSSLANGGHVITAMAIGDDLQASLPATAKCDIQIDSQEQIAALIKNLADPGKRESAVKALARQPAAALPALKAAREGADSALQWWIDATIQEIERGNAKSGGGTSAGADKP